MSDEYGANGSVGAWRDEPLWCSLCPHELNRHGPEGCSIAHCTCKRQTKAQCDCPSGWFDDLRRGGAHTVYCPVANTAEKRARQEHQRTLAARRQAVIDAAKALRWCGDRVERRSDALTVDVTEIERTSCDALRAALKALDEAEKTP